MKLNYNELFSLIEVLETFGIYPIEIEKVSEYLIENDYIRTEEDMLNHILEIYEIDNIPCEWLNYEAILQSIDSYYQIGDDRFVNMDYLGNDKEGIIKDLVEQGSIRKM